MIISILTRSDTTGIGTVPNATFPRRLSGTMLPDTRTAVQRRCSFFSANPRNSPGYITGDLHQKFWKPQRNILLSEIDRYRKTIARISYRTICRFLAENGFSKRDRMKMCGFTSPELVKKGDYSSLQHMLKIMQCNLK